VPLYQWGNANETILFGSLILNKQKKAKAIQFGCAGLYLKYLQVCAQNPVIGSNLPFVNAS